MTARLQHELKKKRPFASSAEEAMLNLMRGADLAQIRFTRLFRDFGITPSQYNVLRILRGEGRPLPILEIASRTVTVVPGITGLVDRLEQAGLVQRHRCDQDRRVIYVSLTETAVKKLAELDQPVTALNEALLERLTAAEIKELIRLLEKMRPPAAAPEP